MAFLRRQERNERRYYTQFYAWLRLVYDTAATTIEKQGVDGYMAMIEGRLHVAQLRAIYEQLYKTMTVDEARIEFELLNGTKATKDIIDDLAEGFPFREGGLVNIWRQVLNEFIQVRIGTRIKNVTATTIKYVIRIIEAGINEGLGGREVAQQLRDQNEFNANRALAIARTETVHASNQGKYLAAKSSPLLMEKRWIPTRDHRTRESHLEMYDSDFIELDSDFVLDGPDGAEAGLYPTATTFSASNSVNCRCALGFRVVRDADGNPVRRL